MNLGSMETNQWNGGTLELDGEIYTISGFGSTATFALCVDLDTCRSVIYTPQE